MLILIVVVIICVCKKNNFEPFAQLIKIPPDPHIFGDTILFNIPKLDLGIDFAALNALNPAKLLKNLFGEKVKNVKGYPYESQGDCPDWNAKKYNDGNTVKSVTTYNNPLDPNENNCWKKKSVSQIKDVADLWGSRVTTAIYTGCGTAHCNSGWKYMGRESGQTEGMEKNGNIGTCSKGTEKKVLVRYDCHG